MYINLIIFFFFFFNDTATTEIYTLSLHDALPIWFVFRFGYKQEVNGDQNKNNKSHLLKDVDNRSEEHTSELQSRPHLVCRLLLEKKKKIDITLLIQIKITIIIITLQTDVREELVL